MTATTEYIAVLPDGISGEHSYIRIPHPRTGAPQLYLPYADGVCEVVKVAGSQGRTWFIGDDKLAEGSMLLHNPVDPFFLAVPVALSLIPENRPAQFQPFADLLSTAASSATFGLKPAFSPSAPEDPYNADMTRLFALKPFRAAFKACCDKKLISAVLPSPPPEGETAAAEKQQAYFRPSTEAILRVLKAKVDLLSSPANFHKFDHLVRSLGRDGLLESSADDNLVHAARIRGAIEQISNFLPAALTPKLAACYDTLALDAYLADRAAAARAAAAPVVKGGKGKNKNGAEDGGAKRKAAASSRGVEQLKKVKTDGMAKLTSFFKPKDK